MHLRLAEVHSDGFQISSFECADPYRHYEVEVERAARTSLFWLQDGGGGDVRELLVLEEGVTIVGLAAVTSHWQEDAYVHFACIDRDSQSRRVGAAFLDVVLEHIRACERVGYAWWRVHPENIRSMKLSERVGAAQVADDETPDPYVRYVVRL
jgi:RimJ/RimL family protein N-acetyltransferase